MHARCSYTNDECSLANRKGAGYTITCIIESVNWIKSRASGWMGTADIVILVIPECFEYSQLTLGTNFDGEKLGTTTTTTTEKRERQLVD